jgi:hypothetical protein
MKEDGRMMRYKGIAMENLVAETSAAGRAMTRSDV